MAAGRGEDGQPTGQGAGQQPCRPHPGPLTPVRWSSLGCAVKAPGRRPPQVSRPSVRSAPVAASAPSACGASPSCSASRRPAWLSSAVLAVPSPAESSSRPAARTRRFSSTTARPWGRLAWGWLRAGGGGGWRSRLSSQQGSSTDSALQNRSTAIGTPTLSPT